MSDPKSSDLVPMVPVARAYQIVLADLDAQIARLQAVAVTLRQLLVREPTGEGALHDFSREHS